MHIPCAETSLYFKSDHPCHEISVRRFSFYAASIPYLKEENRLQEKPIFLPENGKGRNESKREQERKKKGRTNISLQSIRYLNFHLSIAALQCNTSQILNNPICPSLLEIVNLMRRSKGNDLEACGLASPDT